MVLATDKRPAFSQISYSFVVGRLLKPDSPTGQVSTIGELDVSSATGSATLELVRVASSTNSTVVGSLDVAGLSVQGSKLQLSREFFLSLTKITFPIRGYVKASDNRTLCISSGGTVSTGPCSTQVAFSLDVADFNPSCPENIYRFTPDQGQSITWEEPTLVSITGTILALTRSHTPGSIFGENSTTVTYAAQGGQDPARTSFTRVVCSFTVRFDHIVTALLLS
jgi:hypothetical protein